VGSPDGLGLDVDKKKLQEKVGKDGIITLSQLFEKSKSYVGVFSALYTNLLDTSNFGLSTTNSTYGEALNAIINFLYCAALLVPLRVLVVVLFIRIATLWVVIAISPVLILLYIFKDTIKLDTIT
jgi:type IV secretory pathway VirB6-like protein